MSEYSNIINKMVWSYSKLSMYEQCKYAFYLKYIVNDNKQYLDEGNYYAESGSFVHDTLAKIYNNEISSDEAIAYFINNYDNNIFHETYKNAMDSTFEKCSDYFTEKKFEWCSKYEIIDVEKKVNFKINDYRFIGYIDLLLHDKKIIRLFWSIINPQNIHSKKTESFQRVQKKYLKNIKDRCIYMLTQ